MKQFYDNITLYADFETTSYLQYLAEKETRVYLFGVMNTKNNDFKIGLNIESFINYLREIPSYNITCYFHNLAFDGSFILYYLNSIGFINGEKPQQNVYSTFINQHGQMFTIDLLLGKRRITFKDSLKKIPLPISKIGDIVGIKKLSEIHNYEEFKNFKTVSEIPENEIEYLKHDVLILKTAIETFNNDLNFSKNLTSASLSYKAWLLDFFDERPTQENYNDIIKSLKNKIQNILPDLEHEIDGFIRRSYRGGICFVNPKYQNKMVHGKSYDVNSLYPFSMVNRPFPCGQPYFIDKYIKNYKFQILAVEISKAKTDKLPFIPFKQIGKSYEYKQDVKDGIYYLWAEEFELLKKYYTGNFKILNILYFKSYTNLFDKYIYLLYNGKKETTDKGERYIYKLKLNSFGGKFGTKSMKVRKICKGNVNRVGGLQFEFTEPEETNDKYYCAIASYMTSQARCYMIDKINQNFENFIYTDTDSIYIYGDNIKGIKIDGKELGAFKCEHEFDKGIFLRTKTYLIHDKNTNENIVSCAGCTQNAKNKINFDNFKVGLKIEKANLKATQVKGGVVLVPVDFEIKENKRKEKENEN